MSPARKLVEPGRVKGVGDLLLCAAAGALLGLSAPGLEQWYLAWFALVPLFAAIARSKGVMRACLNALVFGVSYNLVYVCWFLQVHPTAWDGLARRAPELMCWLCWIAMALRAGAPFAALGAFARCLPLRAGFLPGKTGGRWFLPSFVVLPFLWVLCMNIVGNAPDLFGCPWAMIEYSQYRQVPLIQAAVFAGGIGIGAMLVLVNLVLLSLFATVAGTQSLQTVQFSSRRAAAVNVSVVALLVLAILSFGCFRLCDRSPARCLSGNISVLQGNLSDKMHGASAIAIARRYLYLAGRCPPGLCVWTEWSVPFPVSTARTIFQGLAVLAGQHRQDWIVGALDKDKQGRLYNAACGLASDGTVLPDVYRKRFLVPFGEYIPAWIKATPVACLFSTCAPGSNDLSSGSAAVVFRFGEKMVAPLICFENVCPDLVAESVRQGGDVLIDCSNMSWFRPAIVRDQMIAFSVFRAVENHRWFAFATTLGPSVLIDEHGIIRRQAPAGGAMAISAPVAFYKDLTFFNRWCIWAGR